MQETWRSASTALRLAATDRLASSAMSATCSPGPTARQVSTAFFAPGVDKVVVARISPWQYFNVFGDDLWWDVNTGTVFGTGRPVFSRTRLYRSG